MQDKYRQIRWVRFLPLLFILAGLPLASGLVPPNPAYGLRTPATLASDISWYRANAWSGWASILAGLAALAVNRRIDRSARLSPNAKAYAIVGSLLAVAIVPFVAGWLAA